MIIRITSTRVAIVTMLLLGTISLIASIGYNSSTLAFIGVGLVFWGGVLLYIRPQEYTKNVLLEAVLSPSLTTLYQMIRELGYKGDTTYLPPKYFANPETIKVYISRYKGRRLPTPEQTQLYDSQAIVRTPFGLLITPPGIQLSRLLEKSHGTSFIRTDFKSLQKDLPKIFVENLEIAENLELQVLIPGKEDYSASYTEMKSVGVRIKSTTVHARITKPIYNTAFKGPEESPQTTSSVGCPVCSAIAIAITKATCKPVRITDIKSSEDGNTLEANYKILEE
jgi:hypothetical protein